MRSPRSWNVCARGADAQGPVSRQVAAGDQPRRAAAPEGTRRPVRADAREAAASKSEMDQLLSDINQAGIGRGLQFELFRPGRRPSRTTTPSCRFRCACPAATTTWRVCRRHRQSAAHRDAQQPELTAQRDGVLALDATAKTYRYLDEENWPHSARHGSRRQEVMPRR